MRTLLFVLALGACKSHKPEASAPAVAKVARATPAPALPPPATADGWDAAAAEIERELAGCTDCRDAAHRLVLARKNALTLAPVAPPPGDDSLPVPERVRAVVAAIDRYAAVADPKDPELPGLKFLAGAALARWRDPEAFDRLAAQLRDYPSDETAEYAANILLDLLNRGGNYEEMRTWVDTLRANPALLAGRPDLRAILDKLDTALAQNGVH